MTDYGAMMVHWMRHRQPYYKGAPLTEMERPSLTYIVDVRGAEMLSAILRG